MTDITHHIPEHLICAYAAGSMPNGFAIVVAAHVSVCDECRARLESEELAGGTVLESLSPTSEDDSALLSSIMEMLDVPPPPEVAIPASGIFPAPVMKALGGEPPRWRPLGAGIRHSVLNQDDEGYARLLYIPPGRAVPDHGHNGLELTMVLQGRFDDETGSFGVGDVEVADGDLEHTPVAGPEVPCICIAATDARLRFRGVLPRLLQPLFGI